MKFRKIFMIEVYEDGELVARRFARNQKIANKIAKNYNNPIIRKIQRCEWSWINLEWVEG